MEKINLNYTLCVDGKTSYQEIVKEYHNLKIKIEKELKEECVESLFSINIEVYMRYNGEISINNPKYNNQLVDFMK